MVGFPPRDGMTLLEVEKDFVVIVISGAKNSNKYPIPTTKNTLNHTATSCNTWFRSPFHNTCRFMSFYIRVLGLKFLWSHSQTRVWRHDDMTTWQHDHDHDHDNHHHHHQNTKCHHPASFLANVIWDSMVHQSISTSWLKSINYIIFWLVVSTPLKNMKVNGKDYPIYYGK